MEEKLGARPYRPGHLGWLVPLLITALAGVLRLRNLDVPHLLIFDETYYAKDAYALLTAGHELVWPEGADDRWLSGSADPTEEGSYVVHPPLGKWLIAIGIQLFGIESGFGWRVSAAVAGTLGVLLITLIAQRMFRSVFLGAVAGVLTAVDGHHLVMSRVAMLDIFLMLFVLAAFGALLMDRYSTRRRLAAWAEQSGQVQQRQVQQGQKRQHQGQPPPKGPRMLWRPWLFAAGILLGAATAVKLSALAFIAAFGIMVVLWDLQARRAAGVPRWAFSGLTRDLPWALVTVLPLALTAYVASWAGWLLTSTGSYRQWHTHNDAEGLAALIPGPLRSLWAYHADAAGFHQGLTDGHDYASSPWTWLFMGRPVSMHYQSYEHGEAPPWDPEAVCGADACSSAILDLANPLIWWTGLIGLIVVLLLWAGRRDWRAGAILAGYAGGFAVWLLFPDRTMFFFYTISIHPFVILTLVVLAALVLRAGTAGAAGPRLREMRRRNTVIVLCFLLMAVAVSVFFHPLWTGELIPTEQWRLRMWIRSWI